MKSWLIALRIARREARRAKGRTMLVVAMIAMPVLALTFAAAAYDMNNLTPHETQVRMMGGGSNTVSWVPRDAGNGKGPLPPPTLDQVKAAMPAGTQVTEFANTVVQMRTAHGVGDLDAFFFDFDRLTAPMVHLISGNVPSGPDEIAVSPTALARLGTKVGASIDVPQLDPKSHMYPAHTYRVVGVAEIGGHVKDYLWFTSSQAGDTAGWIINIGSHQLDEARSGLYAKGYDVYTPRTDQPPISDTTRSFSLFGIGTIIIGLGVFEVVLLAGPAFAVGARRRQRDLALTAANGASPSTVRRIVLADGVFAGTIAAVVGLVAGVAFAFATRGVVAEHLTHERPAGYRVYPLALVVIVLIAIVTGILGALVPALTVSRQDVVAALSGRRGITKSRRVWLFLGLAGAGVGAAVAAFGAYRTSSNIVLAGLVIGELGLVLCTPTIVGAISHVGRFLPVPTRIALRDTARRRSAAAPAISAVMAAVAGSVALTVYLGANDARDNQYTQSVPTGTISVFADNTKNADQITAILHTKFPSATVGTVAGCDCYVEALLPVQDRCPYDPSRPMSTADIDKAKADPRCANPWQHFSTQIAPDSTLAAAIVNSHDAATVNRIDATLKAGGVVVTDKRYVDSGGNATLQLTSYSKDGGQPKETTVTVPAIAVDNPNLQTAVLSRATIAAFGLTKTSVQGVLAFPTQHVTQDQQEALDGTLVDSGLNRSSIEAGPSTDKHPLAIILAGAAALIALGAAAMSTGLAAADGRADLTTLAAVGASPAVRRKLSLSQSGVIALLGSLLGVVAGLGAAAAVLTGLNQVFGRSWPTPPRYPIVVPWTNLLISVVVVPAIAMLGAGLLTRSRLPSERRAD